MTPRPLYPRERTPVPTEQEAGWALGRSGRFGEEKHLFLLPGIELQIVQPVSLVSIQTTLSWLATVNRVFENCDKVQAPRNKSKNCMGCLPPFSSESSALPSATQNIQVTTHSTIHFPSVVNEHGTCSHAEGRTQTVFENRV